MKNIFKKIKVVIGTFSIAIAILVFSPNVGISQSWTNCNELLLTVDDFNTDIDFFDQPADCGCTQAGGECTLVRIKLVETINGVETPVDLHSISFSHPLTQPLGNSPAFRDYIDIFNPCLLYTSPSPRDRG